MPTLDTNAGTPRASIPLEPPGVHLMTPDLLDLDDVALHARLVELRDWHAEHRAWYSRWITTVRQRQCSRAGQEQAARVLGISRATARKSTAATKQS